TCQKLFAILAQVFSAWAGGIGSVAHQPLPRMGVDFAKANRVFRGEAMPLVARAQYSPVCVGLGTTRPTGAVSGRVVKERPAGTVGVKLHVLGVGLKKSAIG